MSHLKQLLATATRQYSCLTLNRCSGTTTLFTKNFHSSPCTKVNVDGLVDTIGGKTDPKKTDEPKKKVFTEVGIPTKFLPGEDYIPTARTPSQRVDGVRFDQHPRVKILARNQNTLVSVNDPKTGNCISYHSGGTVGFKNSKKKTGVCGQTVGFAIGMDLLKKGYKNACIIISGQGNGGLPAMKGVQLAGVNIIAITDRTYPNVTTRPRGKRNT